MTASHQFGEFGLDSDRFELRYCRDSRPRLSGGAERSRRCVFSPWKESNPFEKVKATSTK
jgi:hypothetical protein